MTQNDHSRYLGALLGLAAGDAVGTTIEFSRPGQSRRGHHRRDLRHAGRRAVRVEGIPARWRERLAKAELIESLARELARMEPKA